MKVLFATSNPAKVKKYKEVLEQNGIDLITLKDLNFKLDVEENGKNAIENAYIKAKAYYDTTNLPTIGMDNNLFIEGIPDELQPGVYVRRVGGKELNDDEMIDYYTKLVKRYGGKLIAKWVYGMVICQNGCVDNFTWSYDNFYLIDTSSKVRNPGYPLDSISIMPGLNKYFVELTSEEKTKKNRKDSEDNVVDFILKSLKKGR